MQITDILVSQYSYIGMILAATIANLFPGIPEELFLLSIGYLTASASVNFLITCIFVWVGLLVADSILYYLSYRGTRITRTILKNLLGKNYRSDMQFLRKYIQRVIFFSRFIVHFRSIGPIVAGTIRYPYSKFIRTDMFALGLYVPLILGIGRYFHSRIEHIISGTQDFKQIIFMILIIGIFAFIMIRMKNHLFKFIRDDIGKRVKTFFGFSKIENNDSK